VIGHFEVRSRKLAISGAISGNSSSRVKWPVSKICISASGTPMVWKIFPPYHFLWRPPKTCKITINGVVHSLRLTKSRCCVASAQNGGPPRVANGARNQLRPRACQPQEPLAILSPESMAKSTKPQASFSMHGIEVEYIIAILEFLEPCKLLLL
jgi:hypothetical protein